MSLGGLAIGSEAEAWREEIKRAIDNVKRTKWDKWMRREWHKEAARSRWSAERMARWVKWRGRRRREAVAEASRQPGCPRSAQSKVWVKGRVPKEFLDWVERHWSHDNETRAMLRECCFEVWER